MSLLPTAHAGQAFGARRIDFFTVSGEVVAADAASGRIRDDDGMEHDIRLLERSDALKPGDNATVLRVQAGPNRRSRPAAVINHSRNAWIRTAPDATTLLARSGVTRGLNWWLSVLALVVTAIASVWPLLHAFLTEMNGTMMASVPAFDVFAELNMLIPSLAGWRLEQALSTGLLDTIASLNLVAIDQLTEWGLAAGGLALGAAAYFARSWRLIYVPVFVGFALAAGAILGGPEATLALCGGALAFFLLGGLFNRIRDAGRFNARVDRLAEHVLRNPPQEGIRSSEASARTASGLAPAAAAASAIATAAAVAEGPEEDEDISAADVTAADDTAEAETETAAAAAPGDDAANGEVEAGPSLELPPSEHEDQIAAPLESVAPEASGEVEAVVVDETDSESSETAETPGIAAMQAEAAGADASADDGAADAEPVAAEDTETAAAMAALAAAMRESQAAEPADETPVEANAEAAAPENNPENNPENTPDGGEDDDLPSLDAVAAAAALTATERDANADDSVDASGPAPAADIEDERTMPLASPPPMPASTSPATVTDAAAMDQAAASRTESTEMDEAPAAATPPAAESLDRLAEVETRVEAAVDAATLMDDPLMDDGPDPMLPRTQAGDLAPGAPDLEVEPDPAE